MERSKPSSPASAKDQILAILHKWGIHTLGQLAALDKEQLGARLGPEAIRMWERANGQSNRVLKLVRPPESFEESFEFENEIETAEPLLFMLRRFFEQLARRFWKRPIDRMHFEWNRSRGMGFQPILSTRCRCHGLRYEDFGPPHLHQSCWMKTRLRTFAA